MKHSFKKLFMSLLTLIALLVNALGVMITPAYAAITPTDGMAASLVLGQADFTSGGAGSGATGMYMPSGVTVDPTTGKVFVGDMANNRVLRFASVASLTNGAAAEAVLGQPDFSTTSAGWSQSKMYQPYGVAVDSAGRLWVADGANARVLRFDNASSLASGANADAVLGQTDFVTRTNGTAQNKFWSPASVSVDSAGTLWVADASNSRVLRFDNAASKANGANADGVLGKSNFVTNSCTWTATTMCSPYQIFASSTGTLWVADGENYRVLRFDNAAAKANGAAADGVLGQPDFTSRNSVITQNGMAQARGLAFDDSTGTLYVVNGDINRIVVFNNAASKANGANADNVIGQTNFTSSSSGPITAASQSMPWGGFFDPALKVLWVTSWNNNRVLMYGTPSAPPLPSFTAYPEQDRVEGTDWTPGHSVTLTINSTDYTETKTVVDVAPWNPNISYVEFNFSGVYDLQPGDVVELTDGTTTKTHTVIDLAITDVDVDTDTISGTTDDSSLDVQLWVHPGVAGSFVTVTPAGGAWTADFNPFDFVPGDAGPAVQYDVDGDGTWVEWSVPLPSFTAYPEQDRVEGTDWTPGHSVTLTINSTDYTETKTVVDVAPWNPNISYVEFNFSGVYDLQPGDVVELTDGTTTKTHTVIDLAITDVDVDTDTISGTTDDSSLDVQLWVHPGVAGSFVTVTPAAGAWTADFNLFDFVPGDAGPAVQYDVDGDGTWVEWQAPVNPPTIDPLSSPTNDATPTVTGTADPGNWVDVWYDDAVTSDWEPVCEGLLVDGGGNWSCTWPADPFPAIAEGPFSLGAVAYVGTEYSANTIVAYELDLTAPDITLDTTPAETSNSSVATFGFFANDNVSSAFSFSCNLDGDLDGVGWVDCSDDPISSGGTQSYSGLSEGTHTFELDAVDEAGNSLDPDFASYTWTIDLPPGAPTVTAPLETTNDSTPMIEGTAQAGSSVDVFWYDSSVLPDGDWQPIPACQDVLVNGSNWSCVSDVTLPEGNIDLAVFATDGGGESDPPASHSFTVDTIAPDTQITSHPDNPTALVDASFTFSSLDPTATFECQLDGGGFSACTSPKNYTALNNGSHTFKVRAKDAVANVDATPASYTWIITTVPPVSAGAYDDADAAWKYSGSWASYSGSGPSSNTLHYTSTIGDSAELTFTGTKFTFLFTKDFNRGLIDVFVDGNKVTTLDAYAASYAFQQTYTSPSYSDGLHIVRLVHAGGRPYIDIDAIQISGTPVVVSVGTYDDANPAWTYMGAWASYSGSGPYSDTLHYTNTVGDFAELTFTGTKFALTFTKDSNRGLIDVFVDGSKVTTIDAYSASYAFQQTYTSLSYADGNHTVRLVHAGGRPYIDVDAIQIFGAPVAVPEGTYDDADAAWSYSGSWASFSGGGPSGDTLHYTSTVGNFAELTFTGTKFALTFTRDSNRGLIDVFVDGNKVTTIDAYSASYAFQQTYTSRSFTAGDHTVSLVHAGGRPYIDVDAIQIFGAPVAVPEGTYDDANAAWSYSGSWVSYSGSGPSGNTLHYTSTVGDFAELTFTGTQFTLLFTKDVNRGSIDVFVDGNKVTTIDAYAASYAFQQSYTSPSFTAGDHTVSLVHAGGRPYIDIDAITILP